MTDNYEPDVPRTAIDMMLLFEAGGDPAFDPITAEFLGESYRQLKSCQRTGSLLTVVSLGQRVPWLFRLSFKTRGLGRKGPGGEITTLDRHSFALRFLPGYLRHANRFEMLKLVEPQYPSPFHPNIGSLGEGARPVCVEIYPGESLVEICLSLHDLLRWKLRNLRENDALNSDACIYGRNHVRQPFDDRPLFGRAIELELVDSEQETV